jgi:hypothetical protein
MQYFRFQEDNLSLNQKLQEVFEFVNELESAPSEFLIEYDKEFYLIWRNEMKWHYRKIKFLITDAN